MGLFSFKSKPRTEFIRSSQEGKVTSYFFKTNDIARNRYINNIERGDYLSVWFKPASEQVWMYYIEKYIEGSRIDSLVCILHTDKYNYFLNKRDKENFYIQGAIADFSANLKEITVEVQMIAPETEEEKRAWELKRREKGLKKLVKELNTELKKPPSNNKMNLYSKSGTLLEWGQKLIFDIKSKEYYLDPKNKLEIDVLDERGNVVGTIGENVEFIRAFHSGYEIIANVVRQPKDNLYAKPSFDDGKQLFTSIDVKFKAK